MKQLVDSGASILLVAHAMDQILLFCEEAIWLERVDKLLVCFHNQAGPRTPPRSNQIASSQN